MRRGDVVVAAASGDYGKPRPHLVVQSDKFNAGYASVLLCPITSTMQDYAVRINLPPGPQTGLLRPSQISVDKVLTVRRDRVGEVIGRVDAQTLQQVNRVLAIILGLGED